MQGNKKKYTNNQLISNHILLILAKQLSKSSSLYACRYLDKFPEIGIHMKRLIIVHKAPYISGLTVSIIRLHYKFYFHHKQILEKLVIKLSEPSRPLDWLLHQNTFNNVLYFNIYIILYFRFLLFLLFYNQEAFPSIRQQHHVLEPLSNLQKPAYFLQINLAIDILP